MDMTWQYIAGFFDGEGSVLVPTYQQPRISIAQKRPEVLIEIQKFLLEHDIRSQIFSVDKIYAGKRKILSQLRVNASKEVISFIEGVMPYLIVKKEECVAALIPLKNIKKRTKWRLSELQAMKKLREEGLTAREISISLDRPLRTVEAYCYRDGASGIRYDLIGFTNKL